MKKLLIDINSIVPFFISGKVTGIGRTTLQLVNSLNKNKEVLNFQVGLISQNTKGVGTRQIETSFRKFHIYAPHRRCFKKINEFIPLKELLTGYDILHVPHNHEYVFNPEKTVVTLHDALFMKIHEVGFDHLRMRREVPKLMKKCKGIITCSNSSKQDIVETMLINPNKIDVIHWGIDHDTFYVIDDKDKTRVTLERQLNIKKPYFLSVSCNSERKNTHKLVEAYIRLSERGPVNDLILLWNNPPKFVLKMINEADLESRIRFLSDVTDIELRLLYNGATALIFPSSYEGFGLPILEAMACGTPVVTCRNSSLTEVGGEAAIYIDDPITEDILKSLESFENNEYDRITFSRKGREQASKFTWSKTANNYISVYKKYLGIDNLTVSLLKP
mgnify:CR=1 FL=1